MAEDKSNNSHLHFFTESLFSRKKLKQKSYCFAKRQAAMKNPPASDLGCMGNCTQPTNLQGIPQILPHLKISLRLVPIAINMTFKVIFIWRRIGNLFLPLWMYKYRNKQKHLAKYSIA